MKKKIKVGILVGGPSMEYEVSLNSGKNVLNAIDRRKFLPSLVVLSRKLSLKVGGKPIKFPDDLRRFDIIFIAMHGQFGEDGQIQAILENLKIPFTGSNSATSSLAMDKWASLKIFKRSGLRIASSQLLKNMTAKIRPSLKVPLVLKPRNGGSSVGIEIVKTKKNFLGSMKKVFKYNSEAVVEEYLPGKELTCGVLEVERGLRTLPVIEIRPNAKYEFFDYQAKYKVNASEEIVPAPISKSLTREVQRSALKAHRLLGCQVYSRSDFIWHKNKLYILELNTLPGLTATSLLPKSAKADGISFTDLITSIIESSFNKNKKT